MARPRGRFASAIRVTGLSKRYANVAAVDDFSFEVRAGAVTGFLGPNGGGKTTTLRILLGLARPTAGQATIFGRPFAALAAPVRTSARRSRFRAFTPGGPGTTICVRWPCLPGCPTRA